MLPDFVADVPGAVDEIATAPGGAYFGCLRLRVETQLVESVAGKERSRGKELEDDF